MNAARPPVAAVRPHRVESPNGSRVDPYYWLRDDTRQDPEVLAYLAAENTWTDAAFAPIRPLQERIYAEIVGRIRQDDASVPWQRRGYWYYHRFETGKDYPVHARRKEDLAAPEQVMLDVNAMAAGQDFFQVGGWEVSPDNRLLAWTEDCVGRRQFVLRVKELDTGRVLADVVSNVEASVVWTADSRALLYVAKDPVTLLGDRVCVHHLGSDAATDALIYRQVDDAFYTSVGKTRDERYLLIVSSSTVSTEYQVAAADDPALRFRVLLPRERDHEYQAEHLDGRWILQTNWQAKNFRIVEVEESALTDRSRWRDLVAHRPDAFIEGFELFRDFLAVEERSGGLLNVRICPWQGQVPFLIAAREPSYSIQLGTNPEMESGKVRYTYTSLTTPVSVHELEVGSGVSTLLKRDPVQGDFSPEQYATELVWTPARDGTLVPVSLAWRRDRFQADGTAPMLQYAYGSYGLSSDPRFSIPVLSLLDRGFVYAIAHIRGGQEMGRSWYESGKLLNKLNSFTDFIDVTRHLVRTGHADGRRVFARGGSAGGLLMGAVVNMAPELYRGIIALVPFVDVVTTMLDESIPLTTNEYDEWGDPRGAEAYAYMLRYSPYDNVTAQDYPALFVGTGLWDSQVQYFEPAKWVARLRALKTDNNPLLLRTHMEAGHGGKSGRFRQYQEIAEQWAFIVHLAGGQA
ncbi:MAG: S9 family peptidase [Pseudomonadota bacterium]|nr:S9 family peptidase [Pseudomonadota bacterium]